MIRKCCYILLLVICCAIKVSAQEKYDSIEVLIKDLIISSERHDYHELDYYHFTKYERRDIDLNDIDPLNVQQKFMKRHKWFRNMIEGLDLDNKFSLPLMINERVEENYWRKNPSREVAVITGVKREGLNKIFDSSDILQVLIGEKYSDINIFADKFKLDYHTIISPVGKEALDYYDYTLINTTKYSDDVTVYHVSYAKNGKKKYGLVGDMMIWCDSVPHLKYVRMMLPHDVRMRSIDKIYITQEFNVTPYGNWALSKNDVMTELRPWGNWGKLNYVKEQRFFDFSTDSIDKKLFKGHGPIRYDPKAEYKPDTFWVKYNSTTKIDTTHIGMNKALIPVDPYSPSGARLRVNQILDYAAEAPGMRIPIWIVRAYVNNYIKTGSPSKFVIAPTKALISFNDIDGLRLRFGGTTTGNFNRHFFLDGYAAYGFKSRRTYYRGNVTYSFVEKKYQANEYPRRNISFETRYDMCDIGERYNKGDNDNLFRSLRWTANTNRMFYRMQKLSFQRDEKYGMSYKFSITHEKDEAAGNLTFGSIRTSELRMEVEYNPTKGYYYLASTQIPVNAEAPCIGISHTWGIKGLFGGEFNFHLTELKLVKRWFLNDWGFAKASLKSGAVWNRVPYPLLLSPNTNMSYVNDDESFSLISNMDLINDRYTQLLLSWETNGNFLRVVPILRRMRLKEYFGFRILFGELTDKNNPNLAQNANSDILAPFPKDFYTIEKGRPYIEGVIGIHNILQIFNVDYVHRFSYRERPNARNSGIRFSAVLYL